MIEKFRKLSEAAEKGEGEGIQLALRNVLNVSSRQVPHEEGDLERDGAVVYDKETKMGAVTYGRRADTKDYAVEQHERLDLHHDGGRNAKFLENAFNSTREQNLQIIQQAITRRTLG